MIKVREFNSRSNPLAGLIVLGLGVLLWERFFSIVLIIDWQCLILNALMNSISAIFKQINTTIIHSDYVVDKRLN